MHPLQDIRIVAVEQYGAGPWGSLQLADLGAEVIKVEDPRVGGDVARYVPPFQEEEDSVFFESFNRNKKSISLDLTTAAGREVLHTLVRRSDAVYSNLRSDAGQRLGLHYAALKHVNPKIVCCSLSAYGNTGPLANEPGYDYLIQGAAGWMTLTGEPDAPPTKTGLSVVDFSAGYVAAISLLAGIHAARISGTGMDCDVSLFDVAISMLNYVGAWYLHGGETPRRQASSAHPSLVPFQLFKSADGWLIVACAKEKFWRRLAVSIGRPDLMESPKYATFADRAAHRDELIAELQAYFSGRTTASLVSQLRDAGVPCGPVNSVPEALASEQTLARGMLLDVDHPRFGPMKIIDSAVRVGTEPHEPARAPRRGEHQDYVLRDLLEYSDDDIAELAARGAFGVAPLSGPRTMPGSSEVKSGSTGD